MRNLEKELAKALVIIQAADGLKEAALARVSAEDIVECDCALCEALTEYVTERRGLES